MEEETLKLIKEMGFDKYWRYAGVRPEVEAFICGKDGCIAVDEVGKWHKREKV